jgi:hypothetical protein
MAQARFFHQLIPSGDNRLLAVGGASRKMHLADIEMVHVNGGPNRTAANIRSGER